MDESFFQTLRQIQKKERNNSSLARVSPDFYKQVHAYINKLKRTVGNDPFADEHYLLKDSQRIATEICERREHKITDAAVMNIHRSFHLFSKNKPQFDILDTTPLNLTEEEETLYYSLIDTLKEHRLKISLDKFADSDELGSKREPIANPFANEESQIDDNTDSVANNNENNENDENNKNNKNNIDDLIFKKEESVEEEPVKTKKPGHADAILDKLNQIKNAKVITDEKYEDINKQIANQNTNQNANPNASNNQVKSVNQVNDKKESAAVSKSNRESDVSKSNESNVSKDSSNSFPDVNKLYNEDNQFVNVDELNKSFEDEYYNFNEPDPFEFDDLIRQSKNKNKSKSSKDKKSDLNDKDKKAVSQETNEDKHVGVDVELSNETPKKEIKGKDFDNITIMMNGDVGPIVGVDEKVYGPFNSQDVVILPKINAQIFLDTDKAKLIDI